MHTHTHDPTLMRTLLRMLTHTLTLLARPMHCLHAFTESLLAHRMIWSTKVKAHACVQRREAILRAVRQSPTGLAMSGDGWDYDRQSLRGTSSQAPCPGLGPTEERTHTLAKLRRVASGNLSIIFFQTTYPPVLCLGVPVTDARTPCAAVVWCSLPPLPALQLRRPPLAVARSPSGPESTVVAACGYHNWRSRR